MFRAALLLTAAAALCAGDGYRAIVESPNRSILSSEIAAKIIKISYKNGEKFEKGATLIEYDCSLIKTQKDKIDAELTGLKAKYESYEKMAALNSIGELDVSMARSELRKKEAEGKMADISVSKCQVKAPYDGKVQKTLMREYEYVGEQKELMEIVGTRTLELDILIPARFISSVAIGEKVYFNSDETHQQAEGAIIGINPATDPVSQTIRLRAKLTNFSQYVMPGTVGNVRFGKK
jgi:membrane fusion protein, multidrug efflux system